MVPMGPSPDTQVADFGATAPIDHPAEVRAASQVPPHSPRTWVLTAGAIFFSIYGFSATMRRDCCTVRWGSGAFDPMLSES